jgi:hypothetical protein
MVAGFWHASMLYRFTSVRGCAAQAGAAPVIAGTSTTQRVSPWAVIYCGTTGVPLPCSGLVGRWGRELSGLNRLHKVPELKGRMGQGCAAGPL